MTDSDAVQYFYRQLEHLQDRGWTVVYDSWHRSYESNGGTYCAFSDPARREKALSDPGWDLLITDGRPSFAQSIRDQEYETWFDRGPFFGNVEPLILARSFDDVVPSYREVSQEFRLFHNLYWDPVGQQYSFVKEDGSTAPAIRFDDNRVLVRTRLIRQFQAARQLDFLSFYETVDFYDTLPEDVQEFRWDDEATSAALYVGGHRINGKHFTRFCATRLVPAPPVEDCGVPPFDEVDPSAFPEFVVDIDEDGNDVFFTCDPDRLANYFGKNPESPHYLAMVNFRRDVLQKYYENPDLYTVEDGHISCAGLWLLRIDNHSEDYIRVFLGDIGRDLPRSEREYWKTFNVQPEGSMSATMHRRAFLGEWAAAGSPDLEFRSMYRQLGPKSRQKLGWPLFLNPEAGDASLLRRIRVPLNDSQPEVEGAISIVVKLLVDSINEKEVSRNLDSKIANEKGISKLDRFLRALHYPEADRDIALLRSLQEIRSRGVAHRKSSEFEQTLQKNLGGDRGRAAVTQLLIRSNAMLSQLSDWLDGIGDGVK